MVTSRSFASSDYVLIYEFDMVMRSVYMFKFSNPCQVTSSIYVLMLSEFWMSSQVLRVLNSVFWLRLKLTSLIVLSRLTSSNYFQSLTSSEFVVKFYEFWVCCQVLRVLSMLSSFDCGKMFLVRMCSRRFTRSDCLKVMRTQCSYR